MEKAVCSLTAAFSGRKDRFCLLERGIAAAGWHAKPLRLLEVGCNRGDAAAFLAQREPSEITAIDIDAAALAEALRMHSAARCRYLHADAAALPFAENCFDGIYSEAAFSVMPEKRRVIAQYARVLRPGGRVLLNDFSLTGQAEERAQLSAIPCLRGVLSMQRYAALFADGGFSTVCAREDPAEFMRILLWLCKVYGVHADALGGYLLAAADGGQRDPADCNQFFKPAKLSYCQMVFEKRESE